MSEILLKANQLSKNYGKVKAVTNLSFEIRKGSVYGILGPNGSGKSTTLGIVLSVVNASSGNFEWFEGALDTQKALKKVGAIIERPNFYPYMSARENLELVCLIKEIPNSAIEKALKEVGLEDWSEDLFSTFSLGMKQRLAIASALLNDPEILILDEPTNGLDPQGIHQIRVLIQHIASKGTTILLASHLLDEVEKVCDQVIILQKGKSIYSGSIQEMGKSGAYLLVGAIDIEQLTAHIKQSQNFEILGKEGSFLKIKTNHSPESINKYFSEQGIFLTHLSSHQIRLEELFLEITNA